MFSCLNALEISVKTQIHLIYYVMNRLTPKLSYQELSIQILDQKTKVLRNKEIGIMKVLWSNTSWKKQHENWKKK